MKKKRQIIFVLYVLFVFMLIPSAVYAGYTTADTPEISSPTMLKWQQGSLTTGMNFSKVATPPALAGGYVYYGAANKIYKLDRESGEILAESPELPSTFGWAMMPVTFDDADDPKYVYAFLDYCRFIRLNASDLSKPAEGWFESKESFEKNIMQNNCYVQCIDGKLYSGTWEGQKGTGEFFCVDAATGETAWKVSNTDENTGYYWTGVGKIETKDGGTRILFGGDDGKVYSVRQDAVQENFTGTDNEVVKTLQLSYGIRSIPAVDQDAMSFYLSTTDERSLGDGNGEGALCRIKVGDDGSLSLTEEAEETGSSKNPPVLAGSYVFAAGSKGKIYAFSKDDLTSPKWVVTAPAEVKGEMLVSVKSDAIHVYTTYNNKEGGIFCIGTDPGLISHTEQVIFTPPHMEYSISPVIADEDGTLYYKNDSGFIMAVVKGEDLSAVTGAAAEAVSASEIDLSWDARANAKSYEVLQKSGSDFTKIATVSADSYLKIKQSYTVVKLKAGTKYEFRIRAVMNNGNVSQESETVTAVTGPKAPAGFKAKAGKKKITLTWKKTANATGYEILRATSKKGTYTKIKTLTSVKKVKFINSKLKSNKKYYYKIRAFRKENGETIYGEYSAIVYKKVK